MRATTHLRYQTLFARGLVRKTYLARAAVNPNLELPVMLRSRIIKQRGQLQAHAAHRAAA